MSIALYFLWFTNTKQYLNLRDIQRDIKAAGTRLGNRMQEMEENNPAWMNKINDYYYKKRHLEGVDDEALKDLDGQRYKSVGLAGRWRNFMRAQAEGRFVAFGGSWSRRFSGRWSCLAATSSMPGSAPATSSR